MEDGREVSTIDGHIRTSPQIRNYLKEAAYLVNLRLVGDEGIVLLRFLETCLRQELVIAVNKKSSQVFEYLLEKVVKSFLDHQEEDYIALLEGLEKLAENAVKSLGSLSSYPYGSFMIEKIISAVGEVGSNERGEESATRSLAAISNLMVDDLELSNGKRIREYLLARGKSHILRTFIRTAGKFSKRFPMDSKDAFDKLLNCICRVAQKRPKEIFLDENAGPTVLRVLDFCSSDAAHEILIKLLKMRIGGIKRKQVKSKMDRRLIKVAQSAIGSRSLEELLGFSVNLDETGRHVEEIYKSVFRKNWMEIISMGFFGEHIVSAFVRLPRFNAHMLHEAVAALDTRTLLVDRSCVRLHEMLCIKARQLGVEQTRLLDDFVDVCFSHDKQNVWVSALELTSPAKDLVECRGSTLTELLQWRQHDLSIFSKAFKQFVEAVVNRQLLKSPKFSFFLEQLLEGSGGISAPANVLCKELMPLLGFLVEERQLHFLLVKAFRASDKSQRAEMKQRLKTMESRIKEEAPLVHRTCFGRCSDSADRDPNRLKVRSKIPKKHLKMCRECLDL